MAAVLAVLFAVAVLIPQTSYYGRETRTTIPLFTLWCFAVGMAGGLPAVLARHKTSLLLALTFAVTLLWTFFLRADVPGNLLTPMYGHLYLLMFFAIAAYHAQYSPARWTRMRKWMVLLIGAALLPSLTVLYTTPFIAREIGDAWRTLVPAGMDPNASRLGVGSFSLYTSLAIVIPCWFGLAVSASGWWRLFLYLATGVASVAVVLSTFTAATILLVVGLTVMLVGLPLLWRGRHRWLLLPLVGGVTAGLLIMGASLVQESESAGFVLDKAVRLYQGISSSGLVMGEETGRGEMLVRTAGTFLQHPIFGVGYEAEGLLAGGHSSLVDPWAQYGIVGYLPFFLFQVLLTRRVFRNWRREPSNLLAFGSIVCWGLYWAGSVMNPVIGAILPVVLLFSDWGPSRSRTSRRHPPGATAEEPERTMLALLR